MELKYDRQEFAYNVLKERFDANESMWLSEQLVAYEEQIYKIEYEGYLYKELSPVVSDGEGLQSVGYFQRNKSGKAKILSSAADDLPNLNAKMTKQTLPVYHYGACYGWDYWTLKEAQRLAMPLESDMAMDARDAMELLLDDGFFDGITSHDVPGLFTNANNYPEVTIAAGGLLSKTPEELVEIFGELIDNVYDTTQRRHRANVCLLPVHVESHFKRAILSGSAMSVMNFLRANYPEVRFVGTSKVKGRTFTLASGTFTNKNFICAYKVDPMVLKYKVPVPFLQHPLERRKMLFARDVTGDIAGVEIKNFSAFAIGAADLDP